MNALQIARHRLISQQLTSTKCTTAAELVARFGALQAQEYTHAKWSLGLRLAHLTDKSIEKDLDRGRILRTHVLRPMWHLTTPQDIRWLLMLTAPQVHAANATMYRKLELNTTVFTRCNDLLFRILEGKVQLTRDMIGQALAREKINAEGPRLSYLLMQAELEGIICSGARQGNQFTYALLEERVPTRKTKDPEKALADLTTRYFISRGPATIHDFSTWSGLALTECKKGLAMVGSGFLHQKIDNEEYFFSAHASSELSQFRNLYMLPVYDEFMAGYKNQEALLAYRNNLTPVPVLQFDNALVWDGQIIGTWTRTIGTKNIELNYDLFKPFSKTQQTSFKKAIRRYEAFNERTVNTASD